MTLLADLIRAGVDPDLVARVADEVQGAFARGAAVCAASSQVTSTPRQERNRRYYQTRKERLNASENKTDKTNSDVSDAFKTDIDPPSLLPSPTPPTNNSSPDPSLRSGSLSARAIRDEFDQVFWKEYPHKVGKPAALRAFGKARQTASLAEILDGLDRYRRGKPGDRAWLNPATFLNQHRWADEPAASPPPARAGPRSTSNGFSEVLDELRGASVKPTNDPPNLWSATSRAQDRSSAERVSQSVGGSSGGDYLDLRPLRADTG